MGRRQAIERLACSICGAVGYQPCISRTSKKIMKSFHSPRRRQGSHDNLNKKVSAIDGAGANEEFWQFCWQAFGLPYHRYPGDKNGWINYPEFDAYRGEW